MSRRQSIEVAVKETEAAWRLPPSPALLDNPAVRTLLAGGVAGIVSRTSVAPLERVKILLQVQGLSSQGRLPRYRTISGSLVGVWRSEGLAGLYKGNVANCIRVFPSSAIQFAAYAELKARIFGARGARGDLQPHERLLAGGLAGAIAQFLTYPLDMVRARLSTDMSGRYRGGVTTAIATIVREEGALALFRGLVPSLVGIIPYVGIDFAVYDSLRDHLPRRQGSDEPTVVGKLSAGAVAGACGQTAAYPLDTVRRVLQVQDVKVKRGGERYDGMLSALIGIARRDGIVGGLYAGLSVNFVKVVPSVAISFVVFEAVKKRLDEWAGESAAARAR